MISPIKLAEVHSGGDFITAITVLFKNSFSENSIQFYRKKINEKKVEWMNLHLFAAVIITSLNV